MVLFFASQYHRFKEYRWRLDSQDVARPDADDESGSLI